MHLGRPAVLILSTALVVALPATALAATDHTFSTSQSRFKPQSANQGWYSSRLDNGDANDNYIVGQCCGRKRSNSFAFRNFFTFDLRAFTGYVLEAELVLSLFDGLGPPNLNFKVSEVTTPASRLNRNGKPSKTIYRDLGTGTSYGTFSISTLEGGKVTLTLNAAALAGIQAAQGHFFSMGGRIMDDRTKRALFLGSGEQGTQELVVTTAR